MISENILNMSKIDFTHNNKRYKKNEILFI